MDLGSNASFSAEIRVGCLSSVHLCFGSKVSPILRDLFSLRGHESCSGDRTDTEHLNLTEDFSSCSIFLFVSSWDASPWQLPFLACGIVGKEHRMGGSASISPTWTEKDGTHMMLTMPLSCPETWLLELQLFKEVGIIMKILNLSWLVEESFCLQVLVLFFLSFFLSFFFWCGPFKKYLFNVLQCCFCFMFWVFGHEACEIFSSLTRDRTHTPALEGEVLTTRLPGKYLYFAKGKKKVFPSSSLCYSSPEVTSTWSL